MTNSALWAFVHQGLSPVFHEDPARFVTTLDGGAAGAFLERLWARASSMTGARATEPSRPPLTYTIERPRPGLAIVRVRFVEARATGEPWYLRFIVRDADAGAMNGYTRMFLLEHDAYTTELSGKPTAIVCESCPGGQHRNWGATLAPTDEDGFDTFIIATLRQQASPAR